MVIRMPSWSDVRGRAPVTVSRAGPVISDGNPSGVDSKLIRPRESGTSRFDHLHQCRDTNALDRAR
jgi:hypothetical protein